MNILMITDSLTRGGKERRLVELLRKLKDREEYRFKLVLLKNDIKYEEVFDFENVELTILERKIKKDPRIFFSLYRVTKKFRPDVIHSWGSMPSVYIAPIAWVLHIPFLNAMIADAICKRFKPAWIRAKLTFPLSKMILANSKAGIKAYKVSKKKAVVIYNGFNFDRLKAKKFDEESFRNKYSISTRYVISMIGAFHPRKDYGTYLGAAAEISKKRKDVSFIAAGDGENLIHFRKEYKKFDNIIFTGKINDIENLLKISDFGVLISNPNVHAEGISNSILETMAFGKPVIGSNFGGTPEIIDDKENGFLVAPFDQEDLVHKIEELLDNKDLRERTGVNALNKVNKMFTIENMTESYLTLYSNLKERK